MVIFGSGETSPSGRKVLDRLLRTLPHSPSICLLETPAGFELNSDQVIRKVADFINVRLQNYQPRVNIVPARKRNSFFSPDDPNLASPLLEADMIFMGPGSPTYAVRQLRNSVTWSYLVARHRLGAALVLASAAAIAISAYSLPVYEIYKVGDDLHWKPGLDFFGPYGLPLVLVPHWNNNDGGKNLDTSRCFMGEQRFADLTSLLPPDQTIIGIDENTALILDLREGQAHVIGQGGVTIARTWNHYSDPALKIEPGIGLKLLNTFTNGQAFPLSECCPLVFPKEHEGISQQDWIKALKRFASQKNSSQDHGPSQNGPPDEVLEISQKRQQARIQRDWQTSDSLREKIEELGWYVRDTPNGPVIEKR